MAITKSKRTKFTAAHLTPEVKQRLQHAARKKGQSVSAVISVAVEEKLDRDDLMEAVELTMSSETP